MSDEDKNYLMAEAEAVKEFMDQTIHTPEFKKWVNKLNEITDLMKADMNSIKHN